MDAQVTPTRDIPGRTSFNFTPSLPENRHSGKSPVKATSQISATPIPANREFKP